METPRNLELLLIFAKVAEESSFSKAAVQLGLAKGTVSKSISRLEALVGAELLHRTTHSVSMSTAGIALYERIKDHLTALSTAVGDLPEMDAEPSGLLRIAAAPDFGAVLLPAIVAGFSRRYRKTRFDVRLAGREVDLVKEGFDLAIRVATGALKDSSLKMRRLGQNKAGFYAAPTYLARRGRPKTVDDFSHSWILHSVVARQLKLDPSTIAYLVDDFFLARELMREALGVGILPSFVARGYIQEGFLEEVTPECPTLLAGHLVMLYPSSGRTSLKVKAFGDYLVSTLSGQVGT